MDKRRAVLALGLAAVAAALLIYGLSFHAAAVLSADEPVTAVSTAEPAMIREVTVGGLKRDDSGQIRKTYSGQAPSACPT